MENPSGISALGKGHEHALRPTLVRQGLTLSIRPRSPGPPRPTQGKTRAGSLAWLIEQYRATTDWTDLSPATRRNRENHFGA